MIAILTGHSHYVMQCQFHPNPQKDLIVTCSLDLTARLWSYTTLRQRYQGSRRGQDLPISGAEVTVVAVLEGHKDQINWCSFHPTQSYILTSADDKKIKLWRYGENNKCTEVDTLAGHQVGGGGCFGVRPLLVG